MSQMHFVPIPIIAQPKNRKADWHIEDEPLYKLRLLWGPFVSGIADRGDETEQELFDLVIGGQVQIGIIWDDKIARGLIGLMYRKVGRELIAEVHWATGFGTKNWGELLAEIERYVKDHVGCTIIKPLCRPGWKPLLKKHGYKQTHVVMEKML